MIRKLVFALSLLGACFTGLVHALGLGEATVKSSLNQPLTAEIELVSAGELGIDEILPGLATREEFLRAKVDRVYFLSDLRFEVVENKQGNLAVVLTTTKPVREPFLNFLVEIIWPSGRLLREYALLIDPPLYSEEKALPVQAPTVTQPTIDSASTSQLNSGDQLSVPVPSTRSIAAVNSTGGIGGTYGATTAKDTLWEIAVKARPNRTVTPQQVMLSIQDLNPKAFINKNINKLKAGQVLRLPTLDQIQERTSNQAIVEVIAQNEAISPKRTRSVASAAKKPQSKPSQSASSSEDELKLVVASNQANASSTANSGSSTQAGNGRAESNEDMMLALEKLDKANLENTELNGRVTDLEEQLQTLQRILALKNDQLANIQGQMRANELAANDETGQAAELVLAEEALTQNIKEEQPVPEVVELEETAKVSEPKVVEKKEDSVAEPVVDPVSEKPENFVEMILNSPLYLGLLALGIVVLLAVLWLVSRNNALKEEEYYAQNSEIEESDYDEDSDSHDFDADDTAHGELDNDAEMTSEENVDLDASESVFEEDVDLDSNSAENESEDVIAEADVYIAYGRLDQAATILEDAISVDPVRTDYRLKLLEVYKDSNDADSFNRQFSELEAIQDPAAIEQAAQIRTELLENELVSLEDKEQALAETRQFEEELESKHSEGAAIETEEAALENDTKNFDFDSVEEAVEDELEVDFSSEELELELDVDLELEHEDELLAAESNDLSLELDNDEPSSDSLALEGDDFSPNADDLALDASALDLGSDLVADELNQVAELEESDALSENEADDASLSEGADTLDADLDDVDLTGELDQETEIALSEELSAELDLSEEPEASFDSEPSDVQMDGGETVVQVVSDKVLDEVISDEILDEAVDAFSGDELADNLGDTDDFDFLDGTDEASTKLDLARAYIDMGDVDGAKDILEEVAKEGSDEQQAEAKDLLGSLDS